MDSSKKSKIYFASDFHLGVPNAQESLVREKKIVSWLDQIKEDAKEIYLMGDIFDFWFEYQKVVPKGYVRLFGKLAELTDAGIPIHLFKGNHDIWAFRYLQDELNIQLHRKPIIKEFSGKKFYLAHGDGLGPGEYAYKFLKGIFEFKLNQWLFNWLHPDIGTRLGLWWSRKSRKHKLSKNYTQAPIEEEILYKYSLQELANNSDLNYFVYGHLHKMIHKPLNSNCDFVVIGDWVSKFTYAEFDGEHLSLKKFE